MPQSVISSLFTVHRNKKTVNREPLAPRSLDEVGSTVNRKSFGFTLIELLVVISLIGILSAIGTVSYSSAQAKARDSQRNNGINSIRTAAHLYYQDYYKFPDAGCDGDADPNTRSCCSSWPGYENGYVKDVVSLGITKVLPRDPLQPVNGPPDICYQVKNDFSGYNIQYRLENNTTNTPGALITGPLTENGIKVWRYDYGSEWP